MQNRGTAMLGRIGVARIFSGLLLCLGGCTLPGGALTTFPCKFGPHNFFLRPEGCTCTMCTPWLCLW